MRDIPLPKNVWLRLALAPVLGGAFVLVLPALGFVLLGIELWRWAEERVVEAGPYRAARAARP
jgi:hypothetical protein